MKAMLWAAAGTFFVLSGQASAADCPCSFEMGTEKFRTFSQLEYMLRTYPEGDFRLTGDCVAGEYEGRIDALTKRWEKLMMPPSDYEGEPHKVGIYNSKESWAQVTAKQRAFMLEASIFKSDFNGTFNGQSDKGYAIYGNGKYLIGFYSISRASMENVYLNFSSKVSCEEPTS